MKVICRMNLIIYFTVYSSERSVRMRVTPQYLPFAKSFLVQMRNLGIVVVFIPIMESVCAIAVSKKSSSTVYFVKVFLMTMIMAFCGLSYTFSENIWNLKELRITSLFVRNGQNSICYLSGWYWWKLPCLSHTQHFEKLL